jgi:putative ABC transport system substrate-binding protein
MRRRAFITLLGGATAAWPLGARAQQAAMPVVGVLHQGAPEANRDFIGSFLQGLRQSGYVEGRNVKIESRWAEAHYDRLPALAADLAHQNGHGCGLPPGGACGKVCDQHYPCCFC